VDSLSRLTMGVVGAGSGEDRADRTGHHLRRGLGHLGQHVPHGLHPAGLPGGPRGPRRWPPWAPAGGRRWRAGHRPAPGPRALGGRHREGLVLGAFHLYAKHLPVAVGGSCPWLLPPPSRPPGPWPVPPR